MDGLVMLGCLFFLAVLVLLSLARKGPAIEEVLSQQKQEIQIIQPVQKHIRHTRAKRRRSGTQPRVHGGGTVVVETSTLPLPVPDNECRSCHIVARKMDCAFRMCKSCCLQNKNTPFLCKGLP